MIKAKQIAPDFSLPDQNNEIVRLSDLRGQKVILFFYPKDNTSGCTKEACSFRDHLGRLSHENATVLGISADDSKSHQKFIRAYDLNFTLLADTDHKVCELYGVWKEKSLYGKKYWGIERTTFLIDENGIVQKVFEKVKPEGHAETILTALQDLRR